MPLSHAAPNHGDTVLVLDADQRSALAATRSLGRRGLQVIAADVRPRTLAGCSRHAAACGVYADPATQPARFLDDVRRLAGAHGAEAVLPMTEITTWVLARAATDFAPLRLAVPPFEAFELLSDKYRLFELAQHLGVPVPTTRFVERRDDAPRLAAELGYPVVVKPRRSRLPTETGWITGTVRCVQDEAELRSLVDRDPALRDHRFLLQAWVGGAAQGLFAAYDHGRTIAMFAHRRLRQKPPDGGVSVLSESVPVSPPLELAARQLLDAAGWHGVAMVEFKVADDGTPRLIEINPRLWGSVQLAIDAGVDFPWLMYALARDAAPEAVTAYNTGNRLRWLLGDLDRLYLVLRDGSRSRSARLQELGAFLHVDWRHVRHEVDRWDDLGPFRHELSRYVLSAMGR